MANFEAFHRDHFIDFIPLTSEECIVVLYSWHLINEGMYILYIHYLLQNKLRDRIFYYAKMKTRPESMEIFLNYKFFQKMHNFIPIVIPLIDNFGIFISLWCLMHSDFKRAFLIIILEKNIPNYLLHIG